MTIPAHIAITYQPKTNRAPVMTGPQDQPPVPAAEELSDVQLLQMAAKALGYDSIEPGNCVIASGSELIAYNRAVAAATRAALAAQPQVVGPEGSWFTIALIAQDMRSRGLAEQSAGDELLRLANNCRADLAAQPPAPDPREALAARPLLEQVARLGDRIGQKTVAEVLVISDRAAQWLAENPPGQPVAIEPRGCPTPGASSCVEPPAPAPASNGEREELAQWLGLNMPAGTVIGDPAWWADRIASRFLRHPAPASDTPLDLDALLSPEGAYEPGTGHEDGAQLVDQLEWWVPIDGCDTLDNLLSQIRRRILPHLRPPIAGIDAPGPDGDYGGLAELCAAEGVDPRIGAPLLKRAREAWGKGAQPEPSHDVEGEIEALMLTHSSVEPVMGASQVIYEAAFGTVAREIAARWGRPTAVPVPVSEDALSQTTGIPVFGLIQSRQGPGGGTCSTDRCQSIQIHSAHITSPTLAEAREAARQLAGPAAQVVHQFLDALVR